MRDEDDDDDREDEERRMVVVVGKTNAGAFSAIPPSFATPPLAFPRPGEVGPKTAGSPDHCGTEADRRPPPLPVLVSPLKRAPDGEGGIARTRAVAAVSDAVSVPEENENEEEEEDLGASNAIGRVRRVFVGGMVGHSIGVGRRPTPP